MLEIYTVALFGHRYIEDVAYLEALLEEQLRKIIIEKENIDFYNEEKTLKISA